MRSAGCDAGRSSCFSSFFDDRLAIQFQSLALGDDSVYLLVAFHRPQGLAQRHQSRMASGVGLFAARRNQMLDEIRLRAQAREALRSGKLPSRPAERIVGRHGWSGLSCPVCGEPVKRDEVDVEIQFRRLDPTLGLDCYQLHARRFAVWGFERTKVEGALN